MRLLVFILGLFVVAVPAQAELIKPTADQREQFATLINLNGLLCAQVIEVRKRESKTYYVVCETYRNRLEQRAYLVDLKTGKAK